MITSKIDGYTFHHNGDFSGKVSVAIPHDQVQNWPTHAVLEIPFLVLVELVGRALQRKQIALIEMETGIEFLGIDDVDSLPEMQDDENENG